MKLLSFVIEGRSSYGAVKDNGVVDLGARLAAQGCATLRQLLEANRLADAARLVATARPDHLARQDLLCARYSGSRQDHLRRPELPRSCRGDRPHRHGKAGAIRTLPVQPGWTSEAGGQAESQR